MSLATLALPNTIWEMVVSQSEIMSIQQLAKKYLSRGRCFVTFGGGIIQ